MPYRLHTVCHGISIQGKLNDQQFTARSQFNEFASNTAPILQREGFMPRGAGGSLSLSLNFVRNYLRNTHCTASITGAVRKFWSRAIYSCKSEIDIAILPSYCNHRCAVLCT